MGSRNQPMFLIFHLCESSRELKLSKICSNPFRTQFASPLAETQQQVQEEIRSKNAANNGTTHSEHRRIDPTKLLYYFK